MRFFFFFFFCRVYLCSAFSFLCARLNKDLVDVYFMKLFCSLMASWQRCNCDCSFFSGYLKIFLVLIVVLGI